MPYSKRDLKQHIKECERIIRLLGKLYNYPNCSDVFVAPLYEIIDHYKAKIEFYKSKLTEAK